MTVGLFICSSALVFVLDSAKDAFDVILQIGAGTGLLYLVRWFWWRVNAWCEVVAMVSSFVISLAFLVLAKNGAPLQHARRAADDDRLHDRLLGGHGVSRAGDRPRDARLVLPEGQAVRPGLGGRSARKPAPVDGWGARTAGENIPLALVGWVSGCTMIWSSLFTVGNFLYGRTGMATMLLGDVRGERGGPDCGGAPAVGAGPPDQAA